MPAPLGRTFRVAVYAAVAAAALAAQAPAPQAPPGGQTAAGAQTPPAGDASSAPAKTPWAGQASVNLSLEDGRSAQRTVIASATVQRPDPKHYLSFEGDFQHSSLEAGGARFTAANRVLFQSIYARRLTKRLSLLSRAGAEHDQLRGLHHRVVFLQGLGIQLVQNQRVGYQVTPGVAISDQNKGTTLSGVDYSGGLMHRFTLKINDYWSAQHFVIGRVNFNNAQDIVLDSKTALVGQITKRFNVQLSLYFNHEAFLPEPEPGQQFTRNYANFSAGVGYSW